jgi:hypothetical protein
MDHIAFDPLRCRRRDFLEFSGRRPLPGNESVLPDHRALWPPSGSAGSRPAFATWISVTRMNQGQPRLPQRLFGPAAMRESMSYCATVLPARPSHQHIDDQRDCGDTGPEEHTRA